MKKLLLFIFLSAGQQGIFAQYSRYIVRLKDKAGTPFSISSPLQFLTQRSIDRRLRYNIPLDESDLPVNPAYVDSIRLSGNVSIISVSKWLNQVCIVTTDAAALVKINTYSFVLASSAVAQRLPSPTPRPVKQPDPPGIPFSSPLARPQSPSDAYNYGVAYPQVSLNNTEFLHNHGFTGAGMQLAIMDAGFYHYKTLPVFDSLRINNQVLGTWDFVANEQSVDEDFVHGMHCLSTIAANLPGTFVGTSPKCSFYLFRTEDVSTESRVEEQNWIAAAEKGDSLGADVFSLSLGYNTFDNSIFNYTYSDLNGNTTMIARASDLAAKKGILVVVAAGNEGNSSWKYITTPADADSVLVVGAVNASRQVAGFSSYGPSSDGQIKPDVAAIGVSAVIADQNNAGITYSNGTSYACPIVAGLVTCLWQAFPEVNNMSIIDALRKSSDRFTAPDDRSGYGIPDAKKAFVSLIKKLYTQQIGITDTCKIKIAATLKIGAQMDIVVERKFPAAIDYTTVTATSYTGNFACRNFTYTDDVSSLEKGIIKYRLKMVIGSDTSFYLDSATINYNQSCSNAIETITINPNPVPEQLTVTITRNIPTRATINIYAVSGQRVYTKTQSVNGRQKIVVPMKQLGRGAYFVTVFINNKREMVKKIIRD